MQAHRINETFQQNMCTDIYSNVVHLEVQFEISDSNLWIYMSKLQTYTVHVDSLATSLPR